MPDPLDELHVESLYGARTDAPLVRLTVSGHELLITPAKAVSIAHMLTEAAEAAYSDAFIVRFAREQVGLALPEAVALLREYRAFRTLAQRGEQEQVEAEDAEYRQNHPDE